jgi:hypothetical protein
VVGLLAVFGVIQLQQMSRSHDATLRALLETIGPRARDDLRRVLIRDQADRDAIASRLMRYRDENGQGWADIIDFLAMYPDAPATARGAAAFGR